MKGLGVKAIKVRELMTTAVATLGRNDTLDIAEGMLGMRRIRHLPVVEGGRLLGILTETDVLGWVAKGRSDPAND